MATVQEIYNEIDRINNAKSGIAGAIEEKGVEVPEGAKIEEYPGLVRQIQQGDTSDCVKFTPQTLTEEQKAQARENIGAIDSASKDYAQNDPTNGEYIKNRPGGFDLPISGPYYDVTGSFSDAGDGYFIISDSDLPQTDRSTLLTLLYAGYEIPVTVNYVDDPMESVIKYVPDDDIIIIPNPDPNTLSSFTDLELNYYDIPGFYEDDMNYYVAIQFPSKYIPKELPSGGTAGQVLTKASGTNYDVEWADGSDVFVAEYGVTTYQQVADAIAEGKAVIAKNGTSYYVYSRLLNGIYMFYNTIASNITIVSLRSNNAWSTSVNNNELSDNKVSTIDSSNYSNSTKYPSLAALNGSLYKTGVISQTQTWSGSGSNPRTYVMSNLVTGLIPQANIDLFESVGATFNSVTGYFELNGLTDISYEEMQVIYSFKGVADVGGAYGVFNGLYLFRNVTVTPRTLPPISNRNAASFINGFRVNTIGTESSDIEAIGIGTSQDARLYASSLEQLIYGCTKIRHVGVNGALAPSASASVTLIANNAFSLETFKLTGLEKSLYFGHSSLLSAASVAYMINNAGTATITITLHATAYARAIADADVQAALAAKTNVSLASA